MNTSSFLTALRTNADLPLVFRAGDEIVAPGYHLTEVKCVSYETMDCGGMLHRWSESQFEVWVPERAEIERRGHMAAGKFLRIVDRVEAQLALNPAAAARIHASLGAQPAALYDIAALTVADGQLVVELRPDKTRCKSAERRLAAAAAADQTARESKTADCGCGSTTSEPAIAASCCA